MCILEVQLFPFISETLIGAILLLATIILYYNCRWPEETPVRTYAAYAALCLLSFYYVFMEGKSLGALCNPIVTGKLSIVYLLALSLFIVANFSHSMLFCLRMSENAYVYPLWKIGFWSWPVFMLLMQLMPERQGDWLIFFILWQIGFAIYIVVTFEDSDYQNRGFLLIGSYLMLAVAFSYGYKEIAAYASRAIAIAVPCVMILFTIKVRYKAKRKMFDAENFHFYGEHGLVFVPKSYVTEEQMTDIIKKIMDFDLEEYGLDTKLKDEYFDCLDFAEVANLFIIQYCQNSGNKVMITDSIAKRLNEIIYSESNEYKEYTYRDLFNFLHKLLG